MSRTGRLLSWLRSRLSLLQDRTVTDVNVVYKKATRVGQRRASELVHRFDTRDPRALAEFRDVGITRDDWDGLDRLTLLGDYADGEITAYTRQIESIADGYGLQPERVETVVIAHELGHHEFDTRRPPILDDGPPGWLQFTRRVFGIACGPSRRELEELAAFAFASELVDTELLSVLQPHLPELARQFINGTDQTPRDQSGVPTGNHLRLNDAGHDTVRSPRPHHQ